jgi:hypothetical protein
MRAYVVTTDLGVDSVVSNRKAAIHRCEDLIKNPDSEFKWESLEKHYGTVRDQNNNESYAHFDMHFINGQK